MPKTILTASIMLQAGKRSLTLAHERVADRAYQFKVGYRGSIFHEDDIHVETDVKGFLKGVQANSDDKTADIVEAGAKILLTTVGKTPFTASLRTLPTTALAETHVLSVQFDPFDANDFAQKNQMLHAKGFCLAVFGKRDQLLPGSCRAPALHREAVSAPLKAARSAPRTGDGFFFRRPLEHKIIVFERKGERLDPIWAGWHQFEQESDVLEIQVDRGAFINKTASLEFVDGVLKKYTMKKPSELLGFIKIPTIVVNTIVQIPGLSLTGQDTALKQRETELKLREREISLRQQELKLQTADANRAIYVDPAAQQRSGEPRTVWPSRSRLLTDCRDVLGLSDAECEAFSRRQGL